MTQPTSTYRRLRRRPAETQIGFTTSLLVSLGLGIVALTAAPSISAQQITGEYQVEVRGSTYYLDRTPEEKQLRDNTTLIVKQQEDRITIQFKSVASAMSATTFEGRVGNNRFVAVWTSGAGEVRMITGEVDGRRLRGRLVYPRATADAGVPGWTEVEFSAVPHQVGQTGERQQTPGRVGTIRPPGTPRLPGASSSTSSGTASSDPLPVNLDIFLVPENPTARQKILFTTGIHRGSSVDLSRIDLFVGGQKVGTTRESYFEVTAGPFAEGRLEYRAVAYDSQGRSKVTTGSVMIGPKAPYGEVRGRITGNVQFVDSVSLASATLGDVARVQLNSSGWFYITYVPPGRYWLTVNAGKNPRIEPAEQIEITIRANEREQRNFTIK